MYRLKIVNFLFFILSSTSLLFGQESNFHINFVITSSGFVSNNDNPFWFSSNTNAAVSNETNALFIGSSELEYKISDKSKFSAGVSLFFRDGVDISLQRNNLYIQFESNWIRAVLGSKSTSIKRDGLSSVNDNFSLSGNARAIPGILVEAPKPLRFFKNIFVDYALGQYILNDTRFVNNANIHYKRLALQWKLNARNNVIFGVEHYVQWGGTSQKFGKQPNSFKDFIDVFFARRASEGSTDNDILNALGNHLGIYKLDYNFHSKKNKYNFYHHHPFEDGSGTGLKNFPDGIWGLYFQPNFEENIILKSVVIEYIQTTSQSGGYGSTGGRDNYFSNSIYRSGWTYEGNVIGLSLISPIKDGIGIANNRVMAIHLGSLLQFSKFDLNTKITFSRNYGTYSKPYLEAENTVFTFLKGIYNTESIGAFSLQFGYDYSNILKHRYGLGTSYSYSF